MKKIYILVFAVLFPVLSFAKGFNPEFYAAGAYALGGNNTNDKDNKEASQGFYLDLGIVPLPNVAILRDLRAEFQYGEIFRSNNGSAYVGGALYYDIFKKLVPIVDPYVGLGLGGNTEFNTTLGSIMAGLTFKLPMNFQLFGEYQFIAGLNEGKNDKRGQLHGNSNDDYFANQVVVGLRYFFKK